MNDHFYLKREFDDFAAFEDSMGLWNVQMNQLHCGKSTYSIKQLSLEKAKLNHLVFDGHKTTVGDPPSEQTFAFWSGQNSDLIWRRKRVPQNSVMIYPNGGEHDVMTKGESIHVHTLTFPETVWSSVLTDREAESWHNNILSQELVTISACNMIRLKQIFLSYFKLIEKKPEILEQSSFQKMVEGQILQEIKGVLISGGENCSPPPSRKTTQAAWERIELTLKEGGLSLMSVSGFCLTTGVSDRSLRRLFHDRYGISPKKFLLRVRLNHVRRKLRNCSNVGNRITDIANDHGFWHMGQFAADYRKLFGELPSETSRPTF